jgi:sugar phosphate isomerase/epimerase
MSITPAPAKFGPLLFAGEWERGVETAIELGYDAIELSLRDPQEQVVKDLAKALHEKRFPISTIATGQSYYNDGLSLTSLDESVQAKLYDRFRGFIDLLAPYRSTLTLGGVRGNLTGDPGTFPAQRQRMVEAVRRCAEYAQAVGVQVAIEPINRYETNLIHTVGDALEFIREVGAENLVVLADTFHMNIEEVSLEDALRQAGKRLGYVHFADSNRLAAGRGHVDFKSLAGVLREIGYTGYISAEILPLPDSRTAAQWAIECFRAL